MKRIILLLLTLALNFTLVIPAAAGPKGPGGGNGSGGDGNGQGQQGTRGTFAMTGRIAGIGTDTVTIDVLHGNQLVQPFIGTQVSVTVTLRTRYMYKDGTTTSRIAFSDLEVDQPVSVNGRVDDDVWTVSRLTVGADLECPLP